MRDVFRPESTDRANRYERHGTALAVAEPRPAGTDAGTSADTPSRPSAPEQTETDSRRRAGGPPARPPEDPYQTLSDWRDADWNNHRPPRSDRTLARTDRVSPRSARAEPARVVLNAPQHEAVHTDAQRLLILAGAGTGKTKVLSLRIIRRARDIPPKRIAGLAFGSIAAAELAERVRSQTELRFNSIGTSHSLGFEILRSDPVAEHFGLTSRCRPIEKKDAYRAVRGAIQAHGVAETVDAKTALARILRWKEEGITTITVVDHEAARFEAAMADAVKRHDVYEQQTLEEDYSSIKEIIPVYLDYEHTLRENNLIDFPDMILLPVIALHARPDLRAWWRDQYDLIAIDEYQDTNLVQYDFIRYLLRADAELTCVGDDDQAIFGWRNADIRNILQFKEDFPDATVIALEQNYRSSQVILDLANRVVSRVSARLGKTLWSERKEGPKPVLRAFMDETEEARWIAQDVQTALETGRTLAMDNAVLVRINRMTRVLESAFARRQIPYVVVGMSFYDQEEILDLIAYLQLAHDPHDVEAFLRIANKPRRGLGKVRLEMIRKAAATRQLPPHLAMRALAELGEFPRKLAADLTRFAIAVEGWVDSVKEGWSLRNVLERIIAESDYKKNLRSDVPEETADHVDNIEELLLACDGFRTFQDLLDQASRKNGDDKDPNAVRIMTLHRAKGTEHERVYIAGFEQDMIPHKRAAERGQAGHDEERRLGYVGLTRAKTHLHLCQVAVRGGKDVGDPDRGPLLGPMSVYIAELGADRDTLVDIQLDPSLEPPAEPTPATAAPTGAGGPTTSPAADPSGRPVIDAEFTVANDPLPAPNP